MDPSSVTASSLAWEEGVITVLDQRSLPHRRELLRLSTVDEVIDAITSLAVRGAPAIGLTGALGVALSARLHHAGDGSGDAAVRTDAERLARARPTAVNLSWAVERVLTRLDEGPEGVLEEALGMLAEDIAANQAAVERTVRLLADICPDRPLRLLTHCNTGALATAAVGTALGVVLELARAGKVVEVLVGETRPLLQGARLTAWELGQAEVPYRLCVDSAGPAAIARGMVDCVLIGADRIAANGDTANKIGSYSLALAAARHGVPFVVVAPESTWDLRLPTGRHIVIEERDPEEVTGFAGTRTAPPEAWAYNPAFDVTPATVITALVSEARTVRPGGTGRSAADPADAGAALAGMSGDFYQRGWMPGTAGNLSVRMGAGHPEALVTPSGRDKHTMRAADMVPVSVDTAAALRPGAGRPSAETAIHAAVYRNTGALAVIHVHSPWATAVASRHAPAEGSGTPGLVLLERHELLKGLGLQDRDAGQARVPVFTNWPSVPRIAEEVAAYLAADPRAAPGLLIADHGITVWGADLDEARNRLECFEAMFHQVLLAHAEPIPVR